MFESISVSLTSLAEVMISRFKQDVKELSGNLQSITNIQDPLSMKIMNSLMVLAAWTRTHNQILERHESQCYFGYDHFVRSNSYSNIFVALLGLSITDEGDSIFSI